MYVGANEAMPGTSDVLIATMVHIHHVRAAAERARFVKWRIHVEMNVEMHIKKDLEIRNMCVHVYIEMNIY